jgi:hypothetical protein
MSYLGYPRLHFAGKFLADVSTINNDSANFSPETPDVALGWNPNGTGVFDLNDCVVTKVVYGPGDEATTPEQDPLVGQKLTPVYTYGQPKLVDLDPMQQGVSEIWSMTLKVGGLSANPSSLPSSMTGDYIEAPFDRMWNQVLNNDYKSSVLATAYYQSTLTNLVWDATAATPAKRSFFAELEQLSPSQLSVNFNVLAHNNKPQIYAFNDTTYAKMVAANVPATIVDKLKVLNPSVPTESYLNLQLQQLLGQQDANQYGAKIRTATAEPYTPASDNAFLSGDVVGTIGPQATLQPIYYTQTRMLLPLGNSMTNSSPVVVNDDNGTSRVTLNLGNAIATEKPGFSLTPIVTEGLALVYFDQQKGAGISIDNAVIVAMLPTDMIEQLTTAAGIVDVVVDNDLLRTEPPSEVITPAQANQGLLAYPLGLVSKKGQVGQLIIWLAENELGYNLRADQFVYRMNPGVTASDTQPRGNTVQVDIYVSQFGQPAANVEVVMDSPQAATSGPNNAQDALTVSQSTVTTDSNGVAQFELVATDPGNPRHFIDGQVYFISYHLINQPVSPSASQINVHVYQDQPTEVNPTWDGEIKQILSQYGKLYPIMTRFGLGDYESVKANSAAIATVFKKPMGDAIHMPVTRDLSISRCDLILKWIDSGMAKN